MPRGGVSGAAADVKDFIAAVRLIADGKSTVDEVIAGELRLVLD